MSEKTEPPTPKKLRDAREKGNLMSSKELVSTVVMLGGLLALYTVATDVPKRFRHALDELLARFARRQGSGALARDSPPAAVGVKRKGSPVCA